MPRPWQVQARGVVSLPRISRRILLLLCLGAVLLEGAGAQTPAASSKGGETFSLGGTVVNSVTGEPIARALVRTNGPVQRNTFSDSEGHFQIDGMPAGRTMLSAQKPGYSTEQDTVGSSADWIDIGPTTGALVLKLIPQSAIYGRVADSSGQPIEHIPLRLTNRSVRDGRKHWESRGMTESDEDGRFRFANLLPGTYYLAVGPKTGEMRLATASERAKSGFPHQYYPGVSDLSSALPIQLAGGQQTEADFSLAQVPLYQVAGSVAGYSLEQGVGFQVLTSSGDELSVPTTFNPDTGSFAMEGVPAGSYVLKALSQAGPQPLRTEARINVASNLENIRLALAPAISIPIVVRMESRGSTDPSSSAWNPERPPVSVRLLPGDANATELYSTLEPHGQGHDAMLLQNVESGIYAADVVAQPPWYVQTASYGQTNLLYDDISVAAGGQGYPMEIGLRNDSAALSGTVKSADGRQAQATVVVVPQPASKISPRIAQGIVDTFSIRGLAPGEFLVFAFDRVEGLEYSNPDVLQGYASQAAHVTLTANQKAQVALDLIHVGKGE